MLEVYPNLPPNRPFSWVCVPPTLHLITLEEDVNHFGALDEGFNVPKSRSFKGIDEHEN